MEICMIGTGYVGLVTGACFAEFGVTVTCVDNDAGKIEALKRGEIPFYEPGLKDLVGKGVREGRLIFTTELAEAVRKSIVIFIAVGTPPKEDGSADVGYVESAAIEIAKYIESYKVIVTKSTVPVGTGKHLKELFLREVKGGVKIDVVSNPEFLREGAAVDDFMRPNRVVVGVESNMALSIMKELYRPLYLLETPIIITNIETSELIKYASNAFLATKISFINEIANLCERVGADVHDVARAMGLDGRIGKKFLHAGPGFGGSCFPKDTRALLSLAEREGITLNVVSGTIKTNDAQRQLMLDKILRATGDIKGKTAAFLGLSFKPNTDDIREAPSLYLIGELLTRGAQIKAFDPVASDNAAKVFPTVNYCSTIEETLSGADVTVMVTEWNQFRNLNFGRLITIMKRPLFFDLRNVYDPVKMRSLGIEYYSVGRL
ncbi:UDP-glucose dehydrogenase family protein [Candidatus Magnetominusculus xianensis]|uniref:UDP-glucose 6-dehydrogenase n=1 Tax=Candidatus Magnetominusculus xianensis TaxID=1748249 RepID=A0ABR5SIL7_9BACT|nr:UDP-glucose/GDP-mannose dehydrogenase family protein [Candidatus Magnetominusculus xianensis]KWT84947.1 UDP-glucose 6-dehydrogenase [Candidatus Magnetominusculus xianensis]MBF0404471.1 UDP-glucose/GDP-mannose dehydrogenase family protein [Nitrospirota bacterium]